MRLRRARAARDFADWMSGALRREGLTQEAAARQLGVSVKTVSRWVGGATEPRMRDLRRIQEVFGEVPLPLSRAACAGADCAAYAARPVSVWIAGRPPTCVLRCCHGDSCGRHQLGPDDGRITLRTFRDGLAAQAGHDLTIDVARWSGELVVADDLAPASLDVTIDLGSLVVREGTRRHQAADRPGPA